MNLQTYLDRVGFRGAPRADLDTLTRLHRGHLENVPYENLDILLQRALDFDPERIFEKLVLQRRGGWCYEMNGLFAWALETIGFRVTRMAGCVIRNRMGDAFTGNHLVLLAHLDRDYVADVGFGDGLYAPAALSEGAIDQNGFVSKLERLPDAWWRFHNHQNCSAPSFDFRAEAADPALLQRISSILQTSEQSPFTQNIVLQRRFPDRVEAIRNAFRISAYPDRMERRLMTSASEMLSEMRGVFGVDLPEAETLWSRAEARGRIMLAENPL
ncbi:MAG: arylamine N-acetyltransferase [Terricaulis sp.]